ncbi:MAG: DUF3267 domain-containing protein [Clostridia bacterium]|nr:DUF3267 domain-containing protein [Clostridia bacterium]
MKKYFEEVLPENYEAAKTVDASNKKTGLALNAAALAVMAAGILLSSLIIRPQDFFHKIDGIVMLIFCGVMIAYLVLHELVHGIVYKILTKKKLKFGIVPNAAFCGVPDIYVYRNTALLSLAAPLAVFSAVFIAAALIFENEWYKFLSAAALSVHLGGCAGDIYDIVLYLTKFRDPATLMRDTGPKQTFYVKK